MKEPHPVYAMKDQAYMRPWYARGVIASPYTPKPFVPPRPLTRHPYYTAKERARQRPYYVSPPVQPYHPTNIPLHIGPNIQPTNPAITMKEEAYMGPWQDYKPYRGWPRHEPPAQVNV